MILSRGDVVYFGPAKHAVTYFAGLHFHIRPFINPADFLRTLYDHSRLMLCTPLLTMSRHRGRLVGRQLMWSSKTRSDTSAHRRSFSPLPACSTLNPGTGSLRVAHRFQQSSLITILSLSAD
jgi:hypothetical protein